MFNGMQQPAISRPEVLALLVQLGGLALIAAHLFRHSSLAFGREVGPWRLLSLLGWVLWTADLVANYCLRRRRLRNEAAAPSAHPAQL